MARKPRSGGTEAMRFQFPKISYFFNCIYRQMTWQLDMSGLVSIEVRHSFNFLSPITKTAKLLSYTSFLGLAELFTTSKITQACMHACTVFILQNHWAPPPNIGSPHHHRTKSRQQPTYLLQHTSFSPSIKIRTILRDIAFCNYHIFRLHFMHSRLRDSIRTCSSDVM